MPREVQLGVRAPELLAQSWMVAYLGAMGEGALRPAELEQMLPHAGHAVLLRRLRRLLERELVSYEHKPGRPQHRCAAGVPPRALYSPSRRPAARCWR